MREDGRSIWIRRRHLELVWADSRDVTNPLFAVVISPERGASLDINHRVLQVLPATHTLPMSSGVVTEVRETRDPTTRTEAASAAKALVLAA